ncbi:MAG: hypothetical protein HZC51_11305 [Nitrospirae bacterium]|nr:hypothetical protein [Nitrospirota bacterium]
MKQHSLKYRLAMKNAGACLLAALVSLVLYFLIDPYSRSAAVIVSLAVFSASVYLSAYIFAAMELWAFKKLAEGGENVLSDSELGEQLPEVREVLDVVSGFKSRMDEAVVSQKRFLADASHEMRSPITIMKGNIEIALRREREAAEYREVLASNLEEIERLEYLVKDLMFLARADSSELVVNNAPVVLDEVLLQVVEGLMTMAATKGIVLEMKPACEDCCVVDGDRDRLRQLFVNLIENSLRYTPQGGKVTVELRSLAGVNKVTVSDTGIGIPKDELGKIFERFYRVDKARARESGGTGLGLCISKWIVESHGGEITIESEEGVGTVVTVMFLSSFS